MEKIKRFCPICGAEAEPIQLVDEKHKKSIPLDYCPKCQVHFEVIIYWLQTEAQGGKTNA